MRDIIKFNLIILLFFGACGQSNDYNNQQKQLVDKKLEENKKLELERAILISKYNNAINDFYSKSFNVKKFTCPNYMPVLDVKFTNTLRYTITGVMVGVEIKSKLGNRIIQRDLQIIETIEPGQTINVKVNLGENINICQFRQDQLVFEFRKPFTPVNSFNSRVYANYRDTDIIIQLENGISFREYIDLSPYLLEERIKEVQYLLNLLNP